jgi:ribosomal protein S18 acetylase RimI-like enzyme
MMRAYEGAFEGEDARPRMPHGTMVEHFAPYNPRRVKAEVGRMAVYMASGSQYWFARRGETQNEALVAGPVGLVKVSPSRATLPQKLRVISPNMYVNDIAVSPGADSEGVGTQMLHAVSEYGGFDKERITVLDAFKDTRAQQWLKDLGFVAQQDVQIEPLALSNGQQFEQVRMVGPPVGELVENLEAERQDLLLFLARPEY